MQYDAEFHPLEGSVLEVGLPMFGLISNDKKERFADGHLVRTSAVVALAGEFVSTTNSVYRLV